MTPGSTHHRSENCKTEFSLRFEYEARAVAALNHFHNRTLHDVGPHYLVMEHVEGAELKGPLPVGKAIDAARKAVTERMAGRIRYPAYSA